MARTGNGGDDLVVHLVYGQNVGSSSGEHMHADVQRSASVRMNPTVRTFPTVSQRPYQSISWRLKYLAIEVSDF